jgi:hypothetical protein
MTETQNTPPHARLEIRVERHIAQGEHILTCDMQGCSNCLVETIARMLATHPRFKEVINKAVRLANDRKAQKEN